MTENANIRRFCQGLSRQNRVFVGPLGKFCPIAEFGLNTASRIQEMCNELHAELLISKSVLRLLPSSKDFWYEKQCDIKPRGKSDPINLYKVMLPSVDQSEGPLKKVKAEVNQ
jgi:hypothetical protein